MKALFVLLFLFLEIGLFVLAGKRTGSFAVLLWSLAAFLLGAWVVKAHGFSALQRMQPECAAGRAPMESLFSALFLFPAGIFLMLPGFLTDFLGLLLLIPPVRRETALRVSRRFAAPSAGRFFFFLLRGGMPPQGSPARDVPPRQTVILACTPEECGASGSGGPFP